MLAAFMGLDAGSCAENVRSAHDDHWQAGWKFFGVQSWDSRSSLTQGIGKL
jgi:hypothetical protein